MPNPISGTAVALAATQLRIINLDQVLDTNISTSMNFAIDFANQTFRMTGLQLTDYLNQSLAITAGNVGFDNATFQAVFPLEPSPPTNAQDVIDYGLPILANADAGFSGRNISNSVVDLNTILINQNFLTGTGAINTPNGEFCCGLSVIRQTGVESMQVAIDIPSGAMYFRSQASGNWGSWLEIFSSSTRTNAAANASLNLADTAMQQTDLDAYLPLAGGTVTGNVKGISPVDIADLTRKDYVDAGVFPAATTAVGDVTAFLGVAVVAQPFIAATGATTAYDLIELLLDKVDELETRLANAGIA